MRLNKIKFKGGIRYLLLSCVIVMGLISIIATGGGDGGGGTADTGGGTGTLSISMIDSAGDLDNVWVTIKEVSVHKSVDEENEGEEQPNGENEGEDTASWEVMDDANVGTYDLLALVDGEFVELVTGELEAGHYTQIRLLLWEEEETSWEEDRELYEVTDEGNHKLPPGEHHPYPQYVVPATEGEEPAELLVASGFTTGIKLVRGFDIESGKVTELIFDWEMDKSIIEMPSGEYRLKPTIKILEAVVSSSISGEITDSSSNGIEGATVYAYAYDCEEEADSCDGCIETTDYQSTTTATGGGYDLTLEEGFYKIVVSAPSECEGECEEIIVEECLEIQSATDYPTTNFELADCECTDETPEP